MTSIWWVYDLLVLLIVAAAVFRAAKAGFMTTLVRFLGGIVSFVVALGVSRILGDLLYQSWIRPSLITRISENMQNFAGGDVTEATAQGLSGILSPFTAAMGQNSEEVALGLQTALAEGIESFAAVLADTVCGPVVQALVQVVLFLLVIIVIGWGFRLLAKVFDVFNHLPVIGSANRLLGAFIGFVQGALSVYILAYMVGAVVAVSGGWSWLSTEAIEQTYLFHIFYKYSPFV